MVEISTDKVDMELPAPATGTITEILGAGWGDGQRRPGDRADDGRAPAPVHGAPGTRPRRHPAQPPRPGAPIAGRSMAAPRLAGRPADRRPAGRRPLRADRHRPRRPDHQGRCARRQGQRRQRRHRRADSARRPRAPRPGRAAGAQPIRGGAAALARYMDESRSIPTATSFRTLTVSVLEQRRAQLKEAGHRVSFTHLIAYAIARVATDGHGGDGPPLRRDRRQAAPRRRRRLQPRPGRRRREEGRHAHADGAGHPRRRPQELRRVPRGVQRAGREGADQHADRRRSERRRTSRSPTPAGSGRSPRSRG